MSPSAVGPVTMFIKPRALMREKHVTLTLSLRKEGHTNATDQLLRKLQVGCEVLVTYLHKRGDTLAMKRALEMNEMIDDYFGERHYEEMEQNDPDSYP